MKKFLDWAKAQAAARAKAIAAFATPIVVPELAHLVQLITGHNIPLDPALVEQLIVGVLAGLVVHQTTNKGSSWNVAAPINKPEGN